MATSTPRQRIERSSDAAGTVPDRAGQRPADLAAGRLSRASLILGAFGLGSSVFVVSRLVESWHVTPTGSSHHVSVLGQRLGYPAANFDAVVVLVLAALGLVVTARAVTGTVREVVAARRFTRTMAAKRPRCANGVLVFDDARPHAFCAGLIRPQVYASTGALSMLDARALEAVVAHEAHHARRHDPLRLAAARVLTRALFFVPWLGELARRQQALAELGADENAVLGSPANRSALARAMVSFSDSADGPGGVDPARVDFLLGESPSWRFPAALFAAAAGVIALLVAVAMLAGQVANGSATLAPPFLSRQPCVVVLALIPSAVGWLVAARWRRIRARSVALVRASQAVAD